MANFNDKVYEVVLRIPEGRVATYGQVALLAGNPRAARAVGWALRVNPMPGLVPCHRVVNRAGDMAPGFVEQRSLLEAEGVLFRADGTVDLARCLWREAPDCERQK